MATGAPPTLRFPLILLAAANLTVLGLRMWPWQEALNLPANGVAALDPAICLLAYIFLLFWIGARRQASTRKALLTGNLLGLLGGSMLAAQVWFTSQPENTAVSNPEMLSMILLAGAASVWAIAGLVGSRMAGSVSRGILCGVWSAMTSGLMGCSAVLAGMYYAAPTPVSSDPWKQYEGLAVGNATTQALVHSLNSATWFLLVVPLLGGALAWVLAFLGAMIRQPQKA